MSLQVYIHAPRYVARHIFAGHCFDCKRRTRFLAWSYEWYGAEVVCIRCGRHWSGGEWMTLPSYRYARRDSIADAKARWSRGNT